jgi:hypothetical protein
VHNARHPYVAIHLNKKIYILLYLGIGIQSCFSQTEFEKEFGLTKFDSNLHNRMYHVQIDDYQNVELIEFKNSVFKGTLSHLVWKTNRKEIRRDSIVQKISIPSSNVEKLISELKKYGFENLKDCNEVENCINGADGTTTTFETITSGGMNSASYWELESDYYYNQNEVKLPTEVIKARKLISIIDKQFDLNEQFQNFLNRLPNGRYLYSMLIMKKG